MQKREEMHHQYLTMEEFFQFQFLKKNPKPKKNKDLRFDGVSGSQLLFESSSKISLSDFCHTDPMLDEKIGIFGQANSSQTELRNNQVGKGDLFMFFGWFKNFSLGYFFKKLICLNR